MNNRIYNRVIDEAKYIIINDKITHNEENNSAGYGSIFEKSIAKKENNCIYKSLPSY